MGVAECLAESLQTRSEHGEDAPASSFVPGFARGRELEHTVCHPATGLEGRPSFICWLRHSLWEVGLKRVAKKILFTINWQFLIWAVFWSIIKSSLDYICNTSAAFPWWTACLKVVINYNVRFVLIRIDKNSGTSSLEYHFFFLVKHLCIISEIMLGFTILAHNTPLLIHSLSEACWILVGSQLLQQAEIWSIPQS